MTATNKSARVPGIGASGPVPAGSRVRHLLAGAAAAALIGGAAQAQDAEPDAEDSPLDLREIVVVGTAGGAGIRKQDAAFATTSLNSDDIAQFGPKSTADLLKAIPGVWAESSGGQNGANIFVRGFPGGGDAEFVTVQVNGASIFHPSTLSFLENTQLFRVDQTIERVEGVRGGPSTVFSNGQPGLTVNFQQKTGGDTFEHFVQAGTSDFGERRFDFTTSGPVAEDTSYFIGGFYAASDGIRDSEFTSEEGGQITANIKRDFERGSVVLSARYLNDFGAWLLPIPVIQEGSNIREFEGFDINDGTFGSNDIRLATLPDGTAFDGGDGRGADLVNLGGSFDYDLGGGFSLSNRVSYLNGEANTTGFVPRSGSVQTLQDFFDDNVGGRIAAGAGIASFTNAATGQDLSLDTNIIELGHWVVLKDIENFSNELVISKNLFGHNLSAGVYYADYSSLDRWNLGSARLVTATDNAQRVTLELDNGQQFQDANGFSQGSFFNQNSAYDGTDIALFLSDTWEVTDQLTVDGSVRWQNSSVDATLENNSSVDADGDPDTLFNNGVAVLDGSFSTINQDASDISFSFGANYAFTEEFGVFARITQGNRFPFFDNLREGLNQVQEVTTYESGVKLTTARLGAFATVFYNEFDGLQSTEILNDGTILPSQGGAETFGIEFELVAEPVDNLLLPVTGTFLDAELVNFGQGADAASFVDLSGNQIQRQPRFQVRFAPSYSFDTGPVRTNVFGAVNYVGDRFSDVNNLQVLPNYTKVDAGVIFELNDQINFEILGDNIFNSEGLTEGNPRVIGTPGSDVIFARPILGRSVRFRLGYRF